MAASVTAIPKTEEGGNFFTRMAWYYQMGILLGLVALLLFAADAAFYSDTRAQTRKIRDDTNVLKAENQQGEAIRQNLIMAEATLKEKKAEIEGLRELLPDQVEISTVYDDIKDFMRQQELSYLNRALAYTAGSKEKAAEMLGVSLATLYRKLAGDG